MRTSKNSVPLIPLKDFVLLPSLNTAFSSKRSKIVSASGTHGWKSIDNDYVELFWLRGYGSVLIDFDNYPLSGIAYRHRTWSRPRLARQELDRPLYCLHSGILRWKGPPPSALFDYPFIFGGGRSCRLFD